jgi:putative hydrolase of the HAD superfamily
VLEYLIFDLDETLYARETGLMRAISERISSYMIERMGMDPETVSELRRAYWHQYGTTSRGLQLLHGLNVDDYMDYVHDLDLSRYIGLNLALDAVLSDLPQRKVVFTNATSRHARAVLEVLGIAHHFERIYDAFFAQNEGKPALGAYRRLLEDLAVPGHACLMIEDNARNLRPARSLGMVTILVDPLPGAELDGADYVIRDIVEIGRVVKQADAAR